MISIPVQSLKAGRILASDVKNSHGQLLVKKGAEITDRHIRALKSWGVVEVQLEGAPEDELEESPIEVFDPVALEKARVEVLQSMRHNSVEHPAIDELIRLCVRRRMLQSAPG